MATIEQLHQMKIDEVMRWMTKANDLHLENLELKQENEQLRQLLREYDAWLNTVTQCDIDYTELKAHYEQLHAQAMPFVKQEKEQG